MIFDLRIYSMNHGKTALWLKNYEEHGLPLQRKYLGDPVMFSTTEVGTLNQVVHLWKFESMADREQRREAIAKDPAWQEYLRRSNELGAVRMQENRILKATSFSPLR